jgi:hypothetical protein
MNKQITEAEQIVVRTVRPTSVPNLQTPRAYISQALAPEERSSRADLIKITNLYFDGIEQETGSIVPFDPECNRLENGMRTAGPFDGEPVTMPMAELFKIRKGKIRDVEAIGIRLPYGMSDGWE